MKRRGLLSIALVVLALALAGFAGKRLLRSRSSTVLSHGAQAGETPALPGGKTAATMEHALGNASISPATAAGTDSDSATTNKLFLTAETFWARPIPEPAFAAFHDWAESYLNASSTEKATLEAAGVELAQQRRSELASLIASDPERALELAVPIRVREALPDAIQTQLEERFSGRGRLAVLGALAEPGKASEVNPLFRVATVGEREFKAFVYGRRLGEPTRDNIPLHGIALDNKAAIAEDPVRILEPSEAAAAKARISEPICTVSGLSSTALNQEVAAEIAGEPRFFCRGSHALQANGELTAGESGPPGPSEPSGSPEASTWTEGLKKVLLIRVDFPDLTNQPFADSTGISLISGLNTFYTEMSYGRAGFYTNGAGSDLTPTFRMPQGAGYYGTNNYYDQLRADARSAATAAGYNMANYDRDVICMGAVPGWGWAGLAYVGAAGAWLRSSFGTGVAGHELGHNWGLNHANYWDTSGQSVTGPGTSVEYGDAFDTMGSASAGANHFNTRYKAYLNWLTTNDWMTVTSNGTYRIYAHDNQNSLGTRALRVVRSGSTNYWVEFRQKFTSNKWMMSGAGLRWAQNGNERSQLLDTTPGSTDGKNDSPVVIGRTFSDTTAGIHITPIGKGGTSPESLDVVVNLGTFPGNLAPTVGFAASATNAGTGVTLSFNATATDPDGDALAYFWDFGDGNFSTNNSPSASKSWASAGEYVVRCVVSDMKGGVGSESLIVTIGSPTTYRIGGQITTTNGPVQGVRVYVSTTRMAYTDSDGTYTIVGLPSGTYTVNASLENYAFAASFANPLVVGPNATNANFVGTYSVLTPPTITSQPLSQAVNPGTNVTFTLGATGSAPMYYQWRFNGVNIASATGSSYTKNNVQTTNAGNYSVVVSNTAGTVTSANAVLTVNTPPSITSQPQGQSVISGNSATFNVTASGAAPLSYQWRFSGTNIPGATASSYTRGNVQLADGGNYIVVVTNGLGAVTSAPAALTVNFTLSATATYGGTVTKSPNLQSYPANTVVTLTATPVSVFPFAGWSGGATGTNNPLTVVMTSNRTITANFTSPVPDLLIDNPSAVFAGSWSTSTSASDKYGTDYRTAGTSQSGGASATYTPNISTAGSYDVYLWFPTITKGSTAAQWVLSTAGGTVTNSVGQSTGSGGWQLLATAVNFAQGTNGFIRLNNNGTSGKNVVADAVRLVFNENQLVTTNHPPTLVAAANQIIYAGTVLTATNSAYDNDMPTQQLTFALGPQAPPGASINATNGVLTWNPGMGSVNTTNTVSVRVCDDGSPSLSVTNTFTVAVLPPLSISSIVASNGSATLSWQSISGRTYRVEYKTNLSDPTWTALSPNVTATGLTTSRVDTSGAPRRFYRLVLY